MGRDTGGNLGSRRNRVYKPKNHIKGKVKMKIASRCSACQYNFPCLVIHKFTTEIPTFKHAFTALPIPTHLVFADPRYYVSRDVDLTISNGYLCNLMCVGQHRLGAKLPVLSKTRLGFVLGKHIRVRLQCCDKRTPQPSIDTILRH